MGFRSMRQRLRLRSDLRKEETVGVRDIVRNGIKILAIALHDPRFLLRRRHTGLHATLRWADTDANHLVGFIFLGRVDGLVAELIAVGIGLEDRRVILQAGSCVHKCIDLIMAFRPDQRMRHDVGVEVAGGGGGGG